MKLMYHNKVLFSAPWHVYKSGDLWANASADFGGFTELPNKNQEEKP